MRVTAVDTFGNIGVDESAGYFSVFVSGTGAIQGYISTARDIDGTLYVSLWYPGHNPDTDPADEEKTPVSVSMLFSDQYLYSFANIDPGVGYTVGAFIDQNGSTNTGTDICDNGFDLSGLSLPITVETNLVSQGTDIALAECPDFDAPAIPDAFSIAAGDREIILSWTANGEPDLVGYNIYRGLSATTLILVDDITAPDTSYIRHQCNKRPKSIFIRSPPAMEQPTKVTQPQYFLLFPMGHHNGLVLLTHHFLKMIHWFWIYMFWYSMIAMQIIR